jgi:hypothetical protein
MPLLTPTININKNNELFSTSLAQNVPRNNQLLYLRRALEYTEQTHIAIQALDRVILHIACTARSPTRC